MNCKNCEYAVFDVFWGEYKCEKRSIILYTLMHADECNEFSESENKELKIAK